MKIFLWMEFQHKTSVPEISSRIAVGWLCGRANASSGDLKKLGRFSRYAHPRIFIFRFGRTELGAVTAPN